MKLRGQSNVWYQKHGEYRRMLYQIKFDRAIKNNFTKQKAHKYALTWIINYDKHNKTKTAYTNLVIAKKLLNCNVCNAIFSNYACICLY